MAIAGRVCRLRPTALLYFCAVWSAKIRAFITQQWYLTQQLLQPGSDLSVPANRDQVDTVEGA